MPALLSFFFISICYCKPGSLYFIVCSYFISSGSNKSECGAFCATLRLLKRAKPVCAAVITKGAHSIHDLCGVHALPGSSPPPVQIKPTKSVLSNVPSSIEEGNFL